MTKTDWAALEEDVKQAEGLRLKAYQDSVGIWTIGFGCNLQVLEIPLSLAEQWLRDAMTEAENEAMTRFAWYPALTPRRQRAIVELIYNLGVTKWLKFTRTLAALADRDYAAAADHLLQSLWAKQVGPTRSERIAAMIREG